MQNKFSSLLILVSVIFTGCGGGGGGGGGVTGGASNSSSPAAVYTVSTLVLSSSLTSPFGMTIDANGHLYVADTGANLIKKIENLGNGTYSVTRALGGTAGAYSGCNSSLASPYAVAIDSSGILYVAEQSRADIRYSDCISPHDDSHQYGDLGLLSSPSGIALHGDNRLYVADTNNHKIRLITKQAPFNNGNGATILIAGGSRGYVDGAATNAATFNSPTGVVVSSSGDVYVTDTQNCVIRKISLGFVSTFAGSGPSACGSLDGVRTAAQFNGPTGIAVDANDNLYVADTVSNKIRRITPQGVVTTIAGSGVNSSTDGIGANAAFRTPTGIAVDTNGNIYVVESGSGNIRKIVTSN